MTASTPGADELDLEEFRALIASRQAQLLLVEGEGERSRETVELDQTRVGRLSRMDALQQQAMAKESGRRRQVELTRLSGALQRLDDGEFGYCLRCDELIAVARLRIDPGATLCIGCAGKAEL